MPASHSNTLLLEIPVWRKQEGPQYLLCALHAYTVFISPKPCKLKMGVSTTIPKYVCSPQLSSCAWFSDTGPLLVDFLIKGENVKWTPVHRETNRHYCPSELQMPRVLSMTFVIQQAEYFICQLHDKSTLFPSHWVALLDKKSEL